MAQYPYPGGGDPNEVYRAPGPAPVEYGDNHYNNNQYDNNQYNNGQYYDNQYNNNQYVDNQYNNNQYQNPVNVQQPVYQNPVNVQQPLQNLPVLPMGAEYTFVNGFVTGVRVYNGARMINGVFQHMYTTYTINEWLQMNQVNQVNQQGQNPAPQPAQQDEEQVKPLRVKSMLEASSTSQSATFQVRRGGTFTPANKFVRQQGEAPNVNEKKQWDYIRSKITLSEETKKKLKGDEKAMSEGLSELLTFDEIMGKVQSDSKSYIQLRHTLHGFLEQLASNEHEVSLMEAADAVIAQCENYRKKNKHWIFYRWGKGDFLNQASKIKEAMKGVKRSINANLAEEARKERVAKVSYSTTFSILDEQGFKDNKPKMVDDYVQTTQEKKKYKTLKDMKTRDRDEYLTAEWNRYANKSRNLKRMAETDHWTDKEKARFVKATRVEEVAKYTLDSITAAQQKMKNMPNVVYQNQFNQTSNEVYNMIMATKSAMACAWAEFEGTELDARSRKTLQLRLQDIEEKVNKVGDEYNLRFNANQLPYQWTDLSSKLTLFDEEVEVPLAARQADAVKERVKKGKDIAEPKELTKYKENGKTAQDHLPCFFDKDVTDLTAQEDELARYWQEICQRDKTVEKEAVQGMWSAQDIRVYTALTKVQELRRYTGQLLVKVKKDLLESKTYDANRYREGISEVDWAIGCLEKMGDVYQAVKEDPVFVATRDEALASLRAYRADISDIQYRVSEHRSQKRQQQRRKEAMDAELKQVKKDESEMKFGKSIRNGDQRKARMYDEIMGMTEGLDLKTVPGRREFTKRVEAFMVKYDVYDLLPADMTKSEYQEMKKVNKPFAMGILSFHRRMLKAPNGFQPADLYAGSDKITLSHYDMEVLDSSIMQTDQYGRQIQVTQPRSEEFAFVNLKGINGMSLGTFKVYPNPKTHSSSIKWQCQNNNKEYGGVCGLSSTAEAVNIAFNGYQVTSANISVDQCIEMDYCETVYLPERDIMGETIKKDGEVVMSKEINFAKSGGSYINQVPMMMVANNVPASNIEEANKPSATAEQIFGSWATELKKGNTIITNVYGEALWKGQQAFQNKPGKLNCNHIISICGAVYDQSGNVIQGFLVKDTGGIGRKLPDGSLVEDADGDTCGNYDFVDAYTLALAIKGDQSHKVFGTSSIKINTLQGSRFGQNQANGNGPQ